MMPVRLPPFAARAALTAVLLLLPLVPAPAAEVLRLRADLWCPYNCKPGSDHPGYLVEVAREVFEPLGYQVEYQTEPWSRALEQVRAGQVDGAIGATRDEAAGLGIGRESVGLSANVLVTRKGDPFRYTGIASLKGHTLAAVQDYSYTEELDGHIKANSAKGGSVELTAGDDTASANLRKLLAGRVQLVLEDQNVMEYVLAQEGQSGLVELQKASTPSPLYIAFAPRGGKGAELAQALDTGIVKLRKSGRLRQILARYGLSDWQPDMAGK